MAPVSGTARAPADVGVSREWRVVHHPPAPIAIDLREDTQPRPCRSHHDGRPVARASHGAAAGCVCVDEPGPCSTALCPGAWVWEQAPTSLLARYASIRGASSFGISYPNVYVDGIEVANSLLVTELDVESVKRVANF